MLLAVETKEYRLSMVARSSGNRNMDLQRSGGSERDSLNSSSSQLSNHDLGLPDGVRIPASIDVSMLQGDVLQMLKQLPVERINSAFEQYDYQIQQRGQEIRSKRAYLKGILKAPGGRKSGLPHGVTVPPSVTQDMLEDKELVDALKNMAAKDINSCLRDYDEQIRKKGDMIKNRKSYLFGIVKSGPHYNIPQGVIFPSSVSLASLQGELLETIQRLPSAHINVAFQEYDEQIKKKGDNIRNRSAYLLGIMKRMKKQFEEEASEHVAFQKQLASQELSNAACLSPSKKEGNWMSRLQPNQSLNASPTKSDSVSSIPHVLNIKPGENPQETLSLVTESFVKVTNELVVERKARNDLETELKAERDRKEEASQKVLQLMSDLSEEKEQRERSALEVERLKKELTFERGLRETAEEKVGLLEEGRYSDDLGEKKSRNGEESRDVKQLEMELSIERGLREKTERLLQSAEDRIADLTRELRFAQERLHEERTKSPFGNWMVASSPIATTNGPDDENKKMGDITPSLSGISELVSLADFDPATFSFSTSDDSRIINKGSPFKPRDRLTSELNFVSSAYGENEILVSKEEIIRYLRLHANQNEESVGVTLTLRIPDGYPDPEQGIVDVSAQIADDSGCTDFTRKCVEDSLPSLIDVCRSEAQAKSETQRIISILTTADYWVQIDWFDIQTNLRSLNAGSPSQVNKQIEICRLLVDTTHIDDALSIKHIALKHGLGGYVMVGHPGFLLLEGREENCESCVESLNTISHDLFHSGEFSKWSKFFVVGKIIGMTPDLKSGMLLPAKLAPLYYSDGIEKLKEACHRVGLEESLERSLH